MLRTTPSLDNVSAFSDTKFFSAKELGWMNHEFCDACLKTPDTEQQSRDARA
jgi:hypothetical protein